MCCYFDYLRVMNSTIMDIEEVVRVVLYRNRELSLQVSVLEAEITDLRKQLSRYETPAKDSHNSSIPPSREHLQAQVSRRTHNRYGLTGNVNPVVKKDTKARPC